MSSKESSKEAVAFRKRLSAWLETRPRTAAIGYITRDVRGISFGYQGGSHGDVSCWEFRCEDEPLSMFIGFFRNFSDDDIIVHVTRTGDNIPPNAGATLQFNSWLTVFGPVPRLCHHGRINARKPVSREDLLDMIRKLTRSVADELRLTSVESWPIELGAIACPEEMLDRLFLYAYAIEQVKRSLRGAALLPGLGRKSLGWIEPDDLLSAIEGRTWMKLVRHRQREASLRNAKIREVSARGRLICEVPKCGFDFEKHYGPLGKGYAQVHHLRPLSDRPLPEETRLKDLAIVCANCHAMIHRGNKLRAMDGLIP